MLSFSESQSDLRSEVENLDDEREAEVENEFPWSSIENEAIARPHACVTSPLFITYAWG